MSAELMKPKFVRPSFRLWNQLFLKLLHASFSNFSGGFPWAFFFFFFKFWFFYEFYFVNMGPYGSKNFKTLLLLQIAAESFQTFPEFSS